MADEYNAAEAAKKAWDVGDLKAASRHLAALREAFPDETFAQLGDGRIGRKTGVHARTGEAEYEALS